MNDIQSTKSGNNPPAVTGRRILIVDDDRDVLFFMKLALESEGLDVTCATRGEEALELLAERSYCILLTDQNMPEMDGFELARHARHIQPALTIFMGTGYLYPGIEEQATAAGIREVFGKPFNFQRLFKTLLETISHTQSNQSNDRTE